MLGRSFCSYVLHDFRQTKRSTLEKKIKRLGDNIHSFHSISKGKQFYFPFNLENLNDTDVWP